MIIVAGLSADYEIECRMQENSPSGLERAQIERVVGNQYNILLRQQLESKTLSASKGTNSADRGEENMRPRNRFEGKRFICERKGHHAEECRSVKKKIKNQKMPPPTKRAKVGASGTSAGVRRILRTSTITYEEVLSTGLAIVRSEKLRKA